MNINEFAQKLAEQTKILKQNLINDLNESETLIEIKDSIQKNLIADINDESFSDLFAQTIAYSIFAAKQIYDESNKDSDKFTFEDITFYMPQSNPFLKKLFLILEKNTEFNENISKAILDLFLLVKENNLTITEHERGDLLIHFYEDFLQYYSPETRKALGVWYTPEPVVDYMIDMSQYLLKEKLKIDNGFLNNEFVKVNEDTYSKVQILDPATGTGNYLVRIATRICDSIEDRQIRFEYIRDHLINKLNGFELLMTSYTIANFKLDQLFRNYGYKVKNDNGRLRANIYLTNTLDKVKIDSKLLENKNFVGLLANETHGANLIKEEKPVFVVIGNPPYNGRSKNQSKFITDLMDYYKPNFNTAGGLNDDYIKFFRYAHNLINKQQEGLIAYITNNSFLKSQACQEMRRSLLIDFDEIYILNLNGNKSKQDKNVFDIQANVSITFLVKNSSKEIDKYAKVYYSDLEGSKEYKFQCLNSNAINYKELEIYAPNYFFTPIEGDLLSEYNKGFSLGEIFRVKGYALLTAADELLINTKLDKLKTNIDEYMRGESQIKVGKITKSKPKDQNGIYKSLSYRPFDNRFIYDSELIHSQNKNLTKHEQIESNVYLNFKPSVVDNHQFSHILITKQTSECHLFAGKLTNHTAPLYILNDQNKIESNFKEEFINQFRETLDGEFVLNEDLFAYIYAYLNNTNYIDNYNDLLKQNYPRIPYPCSKKEYEWMVVKGAKLIKLHLFDFDFESKISVNKASKINVKNDMKIYVNNDILFDVNSDIWDFKIGACQVLKNWIKARIEEELSLEELQYLEKMIFVIQETIKIKKD